MPNRDEKYRRMAMRYDIGNRKPAPGPQSEPQEHPSYLIAHACFNCQKSFKLTPEHDHVCPGCGGSVYWMGRAFKTPKQTDDETVAEGANTLCPWLPIPPLRRGLRAASGAPA